MPETLILSETYVVVNCGREGCHMSFAVPDTVYRKWQETGQTWYCPNGHGRVFKNNPIRAELAAMKRAAEYLEADLKREQERRQHHQRSAAIVKGKLRKLKERVAAGICPCCRRPFANLMRHIQHKHPGFATQEDKDVRSNDATRSG